MMIGRKVVTENRIARKCANSGETLVMPSMAEALEHRIDDNDAQLHAAFELGNANGWLFSDRVIVVEVKTEKRVLPVLYEAITNRILAADKIAMVPRNGVGGMKGMMEVFDELGIKSVGLRTLITPQTKRLNNG